MTGFAVYRRVATRACSGQAPDPSHPSLTRNPSTHSSQTHTSDGFDGLTALRPTRARGIGVDPSHPSHPSPPGLARVVLGVVEAKVYAPIWANPIIRSIPLRRWSPEGRCWLVPFGDAAELRARLEGAGYLVRVIDPASPTQPPLVLPRRRT